MRVQLNRCRVSCVFRLQSGHSCVVYVVGYILCKYDCRSGDLFVLSCASVRIVLCVSVLSAIVLSCGGGASSILFLSVCV